MKNNYYTISLFILSFLASSCSITNTVRTHPQFKDLSAGIRSVYIVPAEIVITHKALAEADSRATDKENVMAQTLAAEIPKFLRSQGRSISKKNFKESFGVTADLTLQQLHSAFRKASNELHQNHRKNKTLKGFTGNEKDGPIVGLGSVAKYVSKELGVDSLLISSYIGFEVSTHSVYLEQLDPRLSQKIIEPIENASTNGGVFEIGLIDGKTGNVLWLNSNVQIATPGEISQNWTGVTQNLMGKLILSEPISPLPSVAERYNKSKTPFEESHAAGTHEAEVIFEKAREESIDDGLSKEMGKGIDSEFISDPDVDSKQKDDTDVETKFNSVRVIESASVNSFTSGYT